MARLVGINHVVLCVGDSTRRVDFYGQVFDLELRGRVQGMAFLDMGDQFLVLAEAAGHAGAGRMRHFGLVVDDATRVRRRSTRRASRCCAGRGLRLP